MGRPAPRIQAAALACAMLLTAAGLGAAELYARHIGNYLLWTWELQRGNSFEYDKLKVWNRRFFEEHRQFFRGWRYPLEFFDASSPYPRYLFKPNLRMAMRGGRFAPPLQGEPVFWSSNSWRFRGREFPIEKLSGTIRIVCLGASTTEGSQADDQTYPHYLQELLHAMFPGQRIEVINAGHHGHTAKDLLAIFEQWVIPLHPDVVIWYEAVNDPYPFDFVKGLDCHLGWPFGDCWLRSYPGWYQWLSHHSAMFVQFATAAGWNRRPLMPIPHTFDDTPPKTSEIRYREAVTTIGRETLSHGSKFVLTSLVTLARDNVDASDPRLQPWYPLTSRELDRMYGYFNRTTRDIATRLGVPYIDLANEFPKDPRYFPFDTVHFSPEGNYALARLIADGLKKQVLPGLVKRPVLQQEKQMAVPRRPGGVGH